jgi:hypothetical protein
VSHRKNYPNTGRNNLEIWERLSKADYKEKLLKKGCVKKNYTITPLPTSAVKVT